MTYTESLQKLNRQESSSSTVKTSATDVNAEKNIWSDILQEVQNSTKKTPPAKSVILLGDNESGRSTLISRMKGVESISKGIGLEYHYIDINNEEDRDDTQKLSIWVPDGDGSNTSLLKFALNETNFENTLVALVVSMSTPWSIMDSLQKWAKILTDHINKLNIPDAKRNEYLKQQCRVFQTYQDPDDKQDPLIAAASKLRVSEDAADNDDDLLPLDPAILSKNLGIPIMVIVTKSDSISILDKENEYRIEHFDFIQYHIRRFCLDYGASLFYTTIKDKRTFDKLLKYLTHKLYNFSYSFSTSVVDREAISIPSGWDNEGKINILLESSTTLKSDSAFSDVISKPSIRKPTQRDVETVIAVEDQDFLSRLQLVLNKTSTPSIKQEDIPSPDSRAVGSGAATKPSTPSKPKIPNTNAPDSTNLKNFFQNLLNKNAPLTTPVSTNPGQDSSSNKDKNESNA